jgi:hypothetical protein
MTFVKWYVGLEASLRGNAFADRNADGTYVYAIFPVPVPQSDELFKPAAAIAAIVDRDAKKNL